MTKYCAYDPKSDTFLAYLIKINNGDSHHGWVNDFTDELSLGNTGIAIPVSLFHKENCHGVSFIMQAYSSGYTNSIFAIPVHEPRHEYLDKYPIFEWGVPLMELLEVWNTRSIA